MRKEGERVIYSLKALDIEGIEHGERQRKQSSMHPARVKDLKGKKGLDASHN